VIFDGADKGGSLEAQEAKIRAMAIIHGAEVGEMIVDGGESAKDLRRPGMERLLALVDERKVQAVIVAKLDRLTRSVKDLGHLLERFEKRGVALISVAESLDTASPAERLNISNNYLTTPERESTPKWAFLAEAVNLL